MALTNFAMPRPRSVLDAAFLDLIIHGRAYMPRPAAAPPTLTPQSDTPQPMNTEAPPQPQPEPVDLFTGYTPPTPAEKDEERRRWCIERAQENINSLAEPERAQARVVAIAGEILDFIIGAPPQPQPEPASPAQPAPAT